MCSALVHTPCTVLHCAALAVLCATGRDSNLSQLHLQRLNGRRERQYTYSAVKPSLPNAWFTSAPACTTWMPSMCPPEPPYKRSAPVGAGLAHVRARRQQCTDDRSVGPHVRLQTLNTRVWDCRTAPHLAGLYRVTEIARVNE